MSRKCANQTSPHGSFDSGTRRATFSTSPSRWESICRAPVASSHPLDKTIASKTCRYCSQLVTPVNFGTLVDVNVIWWDRLGEVGPPHVWWHKESARNSSISSWRCATVSTSTAPGDRIRSDSTLTAGTLVPWCESNIHGKPAPNWSSSNSFLPGGNGSSGPAAPCPWRPESDPATGPVAPSMRSRAFITSGNDKPCPDLFGLAPFGGASWRCSSKSMVAWSRTPKWVGNCPRGLS